MADERTPPAPAAQPATPASLIAKLAAYLTQSGRADLAGRATIAASRLNRPATIVCVVGEFKQGKSSLVNALLGHPVCPVDDDLATSAITLVRFGEQAGAVVRRRDGDRQLADPIRIADLHDWVSEAGNPHNGKQVERVEITVPSPLLNQGLVIVDTPGMGGLGAGHAAATLGFLPFADGLIFTSDASAELSAPEVDFLRRATELCPTVMFAQTKIDLYPQWARIVELNTGHLDRQGMTVPIVPVSSVLRAEALTRKDRELNGASRVPEVVQHLGTDVVQPAKANATVRSVGEARAIIAQVAGALTSEREILVDPAVGEAAVAELNASKARLEHLRGPGAKWSQILADRVSDMSNSATFTFRSSTRTIQRMMDERIETLASGDEWDELSRYLQTAVSDQVTQVFVELEASRARVRREIVELLREDDLVGDDLARSGPQLAIEQMWQGRGLDGPEHRGKAQTGLSTMKGAQSGISMFGMLGNLLPTAAGALLATNPIILGVGALFGSMSLADDRRRKVTARRQTARTQVRQFMDDVQFEVGNQISVAVRDIQRELREEFGERLGELVRTISDTISHAQQDGQRSAAERSTRLTAVDTGLKNLAALDRALAGVAS